MNARIIPPGMSFPQALRLGYAGEIRLPGYLTWIRSLPCYHDGCGGPAEASHPNFFKSQTRKGPDPLSLPECRAHHEAYESGGPQEVERLAAAALHLLQAIYEGRLVWKPR